MIKNKKFAIASSGTPRLTAGVFLLFTYYL